MTTFSNIFNGFIWKKRYYGYPYWTSINEEKKDKIRQTVEKTLKFLIDNRREKYTYEELSEEVKAKGALLGYRNTGFKGGVRTDIVLGACNRILFCLWRFKEGNKKYEVPPISCIVGQELGGEFFTNEGANGFIEDYIQKFYIYKGEEDEKDEFVRDKIVNFGDDKWNDVKRILFKENIPLWKLLNNEAQNESERQALHDELAEDVITNLKSVCELKKEYAIPDTDKRIDLFSQEKNVIVEVKIANSNWDCLRHSVGQLFEYDYLNKQNSHLICIGNHIIDKEFKKYIKEDSRIQDITYAYKEKDEFRYFNAVGSGVLKDLLKEF